MMQPKASWRAILWIVPILLIVSLYVYFRPASNQDEYIALAKAYVVPETSQTFEQTLHNQCKKADWAFFETNRGQKVVEFSGNCELNDIQPLNLQFLIDDANTPSIGALLIDYKQIEEHEKNVYFKQLAAN